MKNLITNSQQESTIILPSKREECGFLSTLAPNVPLVKIIIEQNKVVSRTQFQYTCKDSNCLLIFFNVVSKMTYLTIIVLLIEMIMNVFTEQNFCKFYIRGSKIDSGYVHYHSWLLDREQIKRSMSRKSMKVYHKNSPQYRA